MTRFSDEYEEDFPNQGDLWWANVRRALNGKRGQQALRDLETALLELPVRRLVKGHLAAGSDVCAVGALALHRRLKKGERREAILADLEGRTPPECECGHLKDEHDGADGACGGYRRYQSDTRGPCWSNCTEFKLSENSEGNYDGADVTATAGVEVGLAYGLAWRLAYLNDEEFESATPEERYEKVLAWVREAQHEPVPA